MNQHTPTPIGRKLIAYAGLTYLVAFWCFSCCVLLAAGQYTLPALVFPAYFMALLLVLTVFNRTIPLRWVLSCFVLGATGVPLLVLAISNPLGALLGMDSELFTSVIVPVVEEAAKVVPLLVLLVFPRWRYRRTVGATDLMLLGAALGAGFGFYEDALRGLLPGFSPETVLATHANAPHLGPFYFFPNMDVQIGARTDWILGAFGPVPAFVGHGGATALIGLGMGLARFLGAWLRGRIGGFGRVAWVIPLIAWGWMVFDHGMFNHAQDLERLHVALKVPYALDGYGYLSSVALYLLVLATLGLERALLWRGRGRTARLALSVDVSAWLARMAAQPLAVPRFLLSWRVYLRERRGLAYGLYTYYQAGEGDAAQREYLNAVTGALLILKERLALSEDDPQGDTATPGIVEVE